MANNARLPNIKDLLAAGIDPKTGLPLRVTGSCSSALKDNIRKIIRVTDEQDAVNRYCWFNLPSGLTGQLLERILYYKGQGAFFYMESVDTFYFLPYALDGTIDVYGRFMSITPLPFAGGTTSADGNKIKPWITGLSYKPQYEIILPEDLEIEDLTEKCVLLHDYCKQLSETIIPRQILNDPLCDLEAEMLPFARTALLSGTGISGMRVLSEDDSSNVFAASASLDRAALNGQKWIPIVGSSEFQDLTGQAVSKNEEYLMAMQSIDNLRLGTYGLENGGLFEKKAHMLQGEAGVNDVNVGLVYQDGLTLRQQFCNIVNSIWGLGIWCDSSETVINADLDGDGNMDDDMEADEQANPVDEGGSDNDN